GGGDDRARDRLNGRIGNEDGGILRERPGCGTEREQAQETGQTEFHVPSCGVASPARLLPRARRAPPDAEAGARAQAAGGTGCSHVFAGRGDLVSSPCPRSPSL